MGAQLTYGALATGGGLASRMLHPTYEECLHEPRWSWQGRAPKTRQDPWQWASRWPSRKSFGGGADGAGTDGWAVMPTPYEPWSVDGPGHQGIKFVLGAVVDASDVAVNGATIRAFVTSTGAFAGEAASKEDGSYQAPTQNPGVAHFVTAYKVGSPDVAGTTVNTLVPTNLDGT